MVGLRDIGDGEQSTVRVRNTDVDVVGLTAQQLKEVYQRFPAIEAMMDDQNDDKPSPAKIIEVIPEAMGMVGAMGTKAPGDKEVEAKMMSLTVAEQLDILDAIMGQTFGKHWGPLKGKLGGYFGQESTRAATGKVLELRSRLPSRNSLRSATTDEMFGATPPDSSQRSAS